jgi:hypothetical protein
MILFVSYSSRADDRNDLYLRISKSDILPTIEDASYQFTFWNIPETFQFGLEGVLKSNSAESSST